MKKSLNLKALKGSALTLSADQWRELVWAGGAACCYEVTTWDFCVCHKDVETSAGKLNQRGFHWTKAEREQRGIFQSKYKQPLFYRAARFSSQFTVGLYLYLLSVYYIYPVFCCVFKVFCDSDKRTRIPMCLYLNVPVQMTNKFCFILFISLHQKK